MPYARFANGQCDQFDDPRGGMERIQEAFYSAVTTICSPAFDARASTQKETCWTSPVVSDGGSDVVGDGVTGAPYLLV